MSEVSHESDPYYEVYRPRIERIAARVGEILSSDQVEVMSIECSPLYENPIIMQGAWLPEEVMAEGEEDPARAAVLAEEYNNVLAQNALHSTKALLQSAELVNGHRFIPNEPNLYFTRSTWRRAYGTFDDSEVTLIETTLHNVEDIGQVRKSIISIGNSAIVEYFTIINLGDVLHARTKIAVKNPDYRQLTLHDKLGSDQTAALHQVLMAGRSPDEMQLFDALDHLRSEIQDLGSDEEIAEYIHSLREYISTSKAASKLEAELELNRPSAEKITEIENILEGFQPD